MEFMTVTAEGKTQTVGVRISSHPVAQALVRGFSRPMSTTSANVHGQPNPYSVEDIVKQFSDRDAQPDIVLDSGVLPPTPPSKIIDLSKEGDEKVLRK